MINQLNPKLPTFYDLLKKADESTNPVEVLQQGMQYDSRIQPILGYAFNPNFKCNLPEGIPPYIPSQYVLTLAPIEILHLHSKLYILYNKETKRYKKEEIFIRWLEDMAPEEAKLLIAIKDQRLQEEFTNLTLEVFLAALQWDRAAYDNIKLQSTTA